MKNRILALGLMTMASSVLAAGTPCDEIKAEIAAKLDAKGVQGYSLEVVDQGTPAGKVIGSCEAGTKEIVYRRD